jgi:hypothetical protein
MNHAKPGLKKPGRNKMVNLLADVKILCNKWPISGNKVMIIPGKRGDCWGIIIWGIFLVLSRNTKLDENAENLACVKKIIFPSQFSLDINKVDGLTTY